MELLVYAGSPYLIFFNWMRMRIIFTERRVWGCWDGRTLPNPSDVFLIIIIIIIIIKYSKLDGRSVWERRSGGGRWKWKILRRRWKSQRLWTSKMALIPPKPSNCFVGFYKFNSAEPKLMQTWEGTPSLLPLLHFPLFGSKETYNISPKFPDFNYFHFLSPYFFSPTKRSPTMGG